MGQLLRLKTSARSRAMPPWLREALVFLPANPSSPSPTTSESRSRISTIHYGASSIPTITFGTPHRGSARDFRAQHQTRGGQHGGGGGHRQHQVARELHCVRPGAGARASLQALAWKP